MPSFMSKFYIDSNYVLKTIDFVTGSKIFPKGDAPKPIIGSCNPVLPNGLLGIVDMLIQNLPQ